MNNQEADVDSLSRPQQRYTSRNSNTKQCPICIIVFYKREMVEKACPLIGTAFPLRQRKKYLLMERV